MQDKIQNIKIELLIESDKNPKGIIQPITVRSAIVNTGMDPRYEIIAGHRRYWAAKEIGLKEVPATVQYE